MFNDSSIQVGDYFTGTYIYKDPDNYKEYRTFVAEVTAINGNNVTYSGLGTIAPIKDDASTTLNSVLSGTSFNLGLDESTLKRFFAIAFYIEYPTSYEASSVVMYFNRELRTGITRSPIFNLNGTKYYLRVWNNTKANGYQVELVDAVTDNSVDFSTFQIRYYRDVLSSLHIS